MSADVVADLARAQAELRWLQQRHQVPRQLANAEYLHAGALGELRGGVWVQRYATPGDLDRIELGNRAWYALESAS